MKKDTTTEQNILLAAEKIFTAAGYDGARMQAIADEATINKAMLHYYFKSKDALFEKVFDEKAKLFFPQIQEVLNSDLSFIEKVELFIDKYISLMQQYPFIPIFIISTINNPAKRNFITKLPLGFTNQLINSYNADFEQKKIQKVHPSQFIMSLMGMCIFPFLARPIFLHSLSIQNQEFMELMELRKTELHGYINAILSIEK